MKAGLILLKTYESTLLQLKYEDLLHFLINDLIKSGFFKNENTENFIKKSEQIKIKTELISNLENENIQDLKIKDLEEKEKNKSIINNK